MHRPSDIPRHRLLLVWLAAPLLACGASDDLHPGGGLASSSSSGGYESSTGFYASGGGFGGFCGNAILEPPEICDDGTNDGDYGGCSPDCRSFGPHCGDAVVQEPEICDDGINDGTYGHCEAGCMASGPRCGDGKVQEPESCDDGNLEDDDACSSACFAPGTAMWGAIYDAEPLTSDEFGVDIVAVGPDRIVNIANLEVPGEPHGIVHVSYTPDGTLDEAEELRYSGSQLYAYTGAADPSGQLWILGARATATGTYGWRHQTGHYGHSAVQITGGPFSHISGFDQHILSRRGAVGRSAGMAASLVRVETSDRIRLWEHRDAELQYRHCQFDGTGNMYVSGTKPSTSEAFVRKYTHDGVLAWTRFFKEAGAAIIHNMAVDDAGNVYLAAQSLVGPNAVHAVGIGWTSDGELSFTMTDPIAINSAWSDVVPLHDGTLLFVGWTGGIEVDATVRKAEANGDVLWTSTLPGVTKLRAATQDDEGRIFATGEVRASDDVDDPDDQVSLWTGRISP